MILCWVLAFMITTVGAQPEPLPVFTDMKLEQALQESVRAHKVLIVYPRNQRDVFRTMDETTWKNPTLAAWIKWHAIAIRVDQHENAADYRRLQQILAEQDGVIGEMQSFPHAFFFVNGRLEDRYPSKFQHFLFENPLNFPDGGPDPKTFYPKAVQLLLHLDILMDAMQSRNPMWWLAHQQDNPEPKPPEITLLSTREDGDAPAVADPDAAKGQDVLTMLDMARQHVVARELFDATGRYSWLYERGPVVEPSLRPALGSFILNEMAALAKERDGARHRFLALRKNQEMRQPWWSYCDILDWMLIGESLGLASESANYIAAYTLDDQEATMLPGADRAAYSLLGRRDAFSDPRMVGPKAIDELRRQAARVNSTRVPSGVPAEEWKGVVELRTRLFVDEACRVYAALLLNGDKAQAAEVAKMLLDARDDGPTRLMLVMTARVAEAPESPDHARWVREAMGMGTSSPALERRYRVAPEAPPPVGP